MILIVCHNKDMYGKNANNGFKYDIKVHLDTKMRNANTLFKNILYFC